MYSLSYGTPPVATAVGGLRDTITPYPRTGANGFIFADPTPEALLATVRKAVRVWEDRDSWRQIQVNAMRTRFSWETSARQYMDVYASLHNDLSASWRNI